MSRESMLQHLRQQGEETIHRLRQEAEAKILEQRAQTERTLAQRREEAESELAGRLDLLSRTGLMEAKRQADRIRVMAHNQLAVRLKALAVENLAALRDDTYDQVFARLVRELPAEAWEEATVHPDDQGLAAAALPQAVIACANRITGGVEVSARAGRVRVDNTLEKRLERAWPELLARLFHDLLPTVTDDNPAP